MAGAGPDGVLLVDKPSGVTSTRALAAAGRDARGGAFRVFVVGQAQADGDLTDAVDLAV